uniref:Uncharacterized protein n=1 Tax=Marseillevirus sp. TaxID=2809551 RepID=A0AA96J3U5_9VIRU|nr:hypothetical protein MarDSR_436 [Marseillevirus sp.]
MFPEKRDLEATRSHIFCTKYILFFLFLDKPRKMLASLTHLF